MSIDRYGIYIGSLPPIRFYGIILMTGVLAAAYLITREARRRGHDEEIVWDGLIWVVIGGVLGARLWHILTPPPSMVELGITTQYYLTHPMDAIAIWKGGLGIPGAVIGGGIAMYFLSRKRNLDFAVWADLAAPGLALGQAIGRWGNFVNQELYGAPTDLPWGIFIDLPHRLPEFANQEYYHPTFLYESLWSLGSVILLLWISRRYTERIKGGDIFLGYIVLYSTIRFLLEFIRLDSSVVAGLNANQSFVLIVGILSLATLIIRHRLR
jgi:phosphatidylglycerol:prolipoprotein diacylglycerol transferase